MAKPRHVRPIGNERVGEQPWEGYEPTQVPMGTPASTPSVLPGEPTGPQLPSGPRRRRRFPPWGQFPRRRY